MRGHNPLALQVTTCAILGEFTRMFDGRAGHAVLTALVENRLGKGLFCTLHRPFNLNLNGLG